MSTLIAKQKPSGGVTVDDLNESLSCVVTYCSQTFIFTAQETDYIMFANS